MNEFNKRISLILANLATSTDPYREGYDEAAAAIRQAVLELVIGEDEDVTIDNRHSDIGYFQSIGKQLGKIELRAQQRSVLGVDKDNRVKGVKQ